MELLSSLPAILKVPLEKKRAWRIFVLAGTPMSILTYAATLICAILFATVSTSQAEGLAYRDAIRETLAHSARVN